MKPFTVDEIMRMGPGQRLDALVLLAAMQGKLLNKIRHWIEAKVYFAGVTSEVRIPGDGKTCLFHTNFNPSRSMEWGWKCIESFEYQMHPFWFSTGCMGWVFGFDRMDGSECESHHASPGLAVARGLAASYADYYLALRPEDEDMEEDREMTRQDIRKYRADCDWIRRNTRASRPAD